MTTERADRTYHHGDLRRAVLAAAEEVIRTEGPHALSLRDLARRAGVSHAAPAHHFKDRTGLLTAFATEGWALFAAALQAAPDLRERGVAHVRFAREHPAHFQVMFQPALLRADDPALRAATEEAAAALRAGVAGLPTARQTSATAPHPRLAGVAAWSLAHGFASLLLTGNLGDALEGRAPEDAFREVAAMLFGPPASGA
ncbi:MULTISPECIES: TetR/AcrR family transcriptional regulator [Streptomyces]|nr:MULTISPECIES: TetR/AcrR family transcriptional regulator [Streptomyces]MBL3805451.1 TetR/AcrR family transcriptional regulator [Streptomyces sp. BRB081]PJM80431.1 TetR family transcriptional regulator [Streptomyces sp. TSRI0384-2]QNE82323.1 TetR family transcriptional regulator [Streptomyces rutgersensis]RPK89701.1 transcriptional regulator BetI [Streptomyces sp. ADI98-12]SUO93064.1 TetR-family transcriptional regulator [Streptomyces griseus]